jgi:hypothetical protein
MEIHMQSDFLRTKQTPNVVTVTMYLILLVVEVLLLSGPTGGKNRSHGAQLKLPYSHSFRTIRITRTHGSAILTELEIMISFPSLRSYHKRRGEKPDDEDDNTSSHNKPLFQVEVRRTQSSRRNTPEKPNPLKISRVVPSIIQKKKKNENTSTSSTQHPPIIRLFFRRHRHIHPILAPSTGHKSRKSNKKKIAQQSKAPLNSPATDKKQTKTKTETKTKKIEHSKTTKN